LENKLILINRLWYPESFYAFIRVILWKAIPTISQLRLSPPADHLSYQDSHKPSIAAR
jgi:hypothetical protein